MEFCITAEGADALSGGLQGMRGVDAALYYRTLPDRSTVLATGHPVDRNGEVLDNPPLVEDICLDGVLRRAAWHDVLGFGLVGHWTTCWDVSLRVNDRFKDDLWGGYLVQGKAGCLSAVAHPPHSGSLVAKWPSSQDVAKCNMLKCDLAAVECDLAGGPWPHGAGSADLFGPQWDAVPSLPGGLAAGRRAAYGVNSLVGLGDHPLLQALGSEQDLERAEVLARTLLLAMFVSSGTPLVTANTLNRKGLWRFTAMMTAVRKQYMDLINPPLTFAPLAAGAVPSKPVRELRWHGAGPGAEVDWHNAAQGVAPSNLIAFTLRDSGERALYVAFNPYPHHVSVALPGPAAAGAWRLVVDTSRLPPEDIDLEGPLLPVGQPLFDVAPQAGILLISAAPGATSTRTAPSAPGPPYDDGPAPSTPKSYSGPGGATVVRSSSPNVGTIVSSRPGSVSPSRGIWMDGKVILHK
ncbi:hypothetical protein QJQ45_012210 [Haematococcus lacustris]|nr:hypothetical protein QJQ45_012210 [Haematococcus lacustris]